MSHLYFNHKLSKILEADDLTKIARTLADAGEDTVNRRELLRRGAGAVAAGGLGSASQAAASKPLFDILRANPSLWRSLMIALTSPGGFGAVNLLGHPSQFERRGQSVPINHLRSPSTHLMKQSVGQLTNSWIPQLMRRKEDMGLTGNTDISAWGPIDKEGEFDAQLEFIDDLIVTSREALSYLTTDQIKFLSKSVPDLKDKVMTMIQNSYREYEDESRYAFDIREVDKLAPQHFDVNGTNSKLLHALGIDGNDIIHKWYDNLKGLAQSYDSDHFYSTRFKDCVKKNGEGALRRIQDEINYLRLHINPSGLKNFLQQLDVKFDPALLNNLGNELQTFSKEVDNQFRLRYRDERLKQMQEKKVKDQRDRMQDQYDLMRWEGEGGALGPTTESKFARRLSRILLAKT